MLNKIPYKVFYWEMTSLLHASSLRVFSRQRLVACLFDFDALLHPFALILVPPNPINGGGFDSSKTLGHSTSDYSVAFPSGGEDIAMEEGGSFPTMEKLLPKHPTS